MSRLNVYFLRRTDNFQLIGGYTERDVVRICSHVKAEPFNLIVEKIKKVIF